MYWMGCKRKREITHVCPCSYERTVAIPYMYSSTIRQWDSSPHAGFTTGNPWMRVNDDYPETWNASAQVNDDASVWTFWKTALATRKEHEVLVRS